MRLLLKLQLILHENIINIYKSNYNWDQQTSMLIERCPDFNPFKYSRDVYSSHLSKEIDYLHSNLIKKKNTPTNTLWEFELLLSKLSPKAEGLTSWHLLYTMKYWMQSQYRTCINSYDERQRKLAERWWLHGPRSPLLQLIQFTIINGLPVYNWERLQTNSVIYLLPFSVGSIFIFW